MEELFDKYLKQEMDEQERAAFEQNMQESPSLKADFETYAFLWNGISKLPFPEPENSLQMGFQQMLNTELKAEKSPKVRSLWSNKWSIAAGILLAGFLAGMGIQKLNTPKEDVAGLGKELKEMKELMMLQMLQNPMATERLKAVSYTEDLQNPNDKIIEALLTTLNNDENVNVRLVTLESLLAMADNPTVREGLVKSIGYQDSPIIQTALADAMIQIQEKAAIAPFKKLIDDSNTNSMVKEKLEKTTNQLEVI